MTWNPHKLLAAPQQCSTFLTRHEKILQECHSAEAQYLFQTDKFYDIKYDTGDKHIQCGRRADVLKFWFMWKAKVRYEKVVKIFQNCNKTFFFFFRDHPDLKNTSTEYSITFAISKTKLRKGTTLNWSSQNQNAPTSASGTFLLVFVKTKTIQRTVCTR